MANISFFFPKQKQGGALGLNGGLEHGRQRHELVAPLVVSLSIFAVFGSQGVKQPDGTSLYLANASWIWVPFLAIFTIAAWFGMKRSCYLESLHQGAVAGTQTGSSVDYEPAVSGSLRSFIGFSAGFAMLSKTQFPDVQILQYAFFGCLLVRWRVLQVVNHPDCLAATRHAVNFILMAIFSGLLFLTLPTDGQGGSFMAFFAVFLALFLTAGLGSESVSR